MKSIRGSGGSSLYQIQSLGAIMIAPSRLSQIVLALICCALVIAGAPTQAQSLTSPRGQLSWWTGNGVSTDAVGNNHGSLLNGAGYAPGFVGQAFSFDGIDDVVLVPNASSLSFAPTSPMTTDGWVLRTSSATVMHLWGKRPGCAGAINYQMFIDENIGCGVGFGGDGGGVCAAVSLLPNTWNHLAATFDGANFRLYVNGALVGISTGTLGAQNSADFEIGGSGTCPRFAGRLDEVEFFNRALSDQEIMAIYEAGHVGKSLGTCLGNWSDSFDDGVLDSKWLNTGNCGPALEVGGELVLTVPDNCTGVVEVHTDSRKDVVCGDFDIQVDFTLPSWPTPPTGRRFAGPLIIPALGEGGPTLGVAERHRIDAPVSCSADYTDFYKFFSTDPEFCAGTTVRVPTSDLQGRFRIKREGGTLREFLWNGVNWVEELTNSTDMLPITVQLYSVTQSGLIVGHDAHFDNLTIESTATSGGEVPTLSVRQEAGGDLTLDWAPSCQPGDSDYEIYEGAIGDFSSHTARSCSTGGLTTTTFTPGSGNSYYLVVPRTATREGSYGRASDRTRRVQGIVACLPQETGGCP